MTRRSWLSRLSLLLVSTALSIFVADLLLLFYESRSAAYLMPEPGVSGTVDLAALNYNDTTALTASGGNEFRVLAFGDSFAYSVMSPAFSYSGILASRLDAVAAKDVRVLNLGEPATSLNDYMAAYRHWAQIFEHDAVLFHIYLGNDLLDIAYRFVPPEWTPNRVFGKLDHSVVHGRQRRIPRKYPLRLLDYGYAVMLSITNSQPATEPPSQEYNLASLENLKPEGFLNTNFAQMDNFDPEKFDALVPGYRAANELMKFAEGIASTGIKVAIALGPNEPLVNPEFRSEVLAHYESDQSRYDFRLSARLLNELQRQAAPSVTWIDMVEYFQADYSARGQNLFHNRNTHWGKEGNQLAGEVLAAHLAKPWLESAIELPADLEQGQAKLLAAYQPSVSEEQMQAFVARILSRTERPRVASVDGVSNSSVLFDGIFDGEANWVATANGQPIEVLFQDPQSLEAVNLHLYDTDGRHYRLRVETLEAGAWTTRIDGPPEGVSKMLRVPLSGLEIEGLRVTGEYNSDQELNPENTFLHLHEIELLVAEAGEAN